MAVSDAQCVMVRGKVYVGGGHMADDFYLLYQYDPAMDSWDTLPRCPVCHFALGEFQGELILVGGTTGIIEFTGKVHRYNEQHRQWEECLQPMPTARTELSIFTTESAIIACGGQEEKVFKACATVEVYLAETGQWHPAEPLPMTCFQMSSVRIGDNGYLLGGDTYSWMRHPYGEPTKAVFCVSLPSLVEKATSTTPSEGTVWKSLPPTPYTNSSAASLRGQLLAIAGYDDSDGVWNNTPIQHVYLPSAMNWERMSGNLPVTLTSATSLQLNDSQLLVCGGYADFFRSEKAYLGTVMDES